MALLLEVVSGHAGGMGANRTCVVRSGAVCIGRDEKCEWVIPDPYISRQHVTVRPLNGMYFIEGVGRVPVAVNDRSRLLVNNEPRLVANGDILFIEEYEIRVSVISDVEAAQLQAQRGTIPMLGELEAEPTREVPVAPQRSSRDVLDIVGGGRRAPPRPEAKPLRSAGDELLDRAYEPSSVAPNRVSGQGADSQLSDDWYRHPGTAALESTDSSEPDADTGAGIAEDWYRSPAQSESSLASRPLPAATSAPAPRPSAATTSDALRAILIGAGLDPVQVQVPATAAGPLGAVLRIVVDGTMDVLRARAEIKNQFRLPVTRIAREDNNPLKFSPDAAQALITLLTGQNPAYLGAEEAFGDAFEDIRLHQLALLKGVQAGFERMLAAFDPERLQDSADTGAIRALAGGKARSWERYVEHYGRLKSDREETFRRLFGDGFGAAYEEELRRLKAARRGAKPARREGQ